MCRIVGLWKSSLAETNLKASKALADPTEYENLFTGVTDSLKTEQFLEPERNRVIPASQYASVPVSIDQL